MNKLIISNLLLYFLVYVLQIDNQNSFFNSFHSFYRLILGDFSYFDSFTHDSIAAKLIWLFFFFGTLFITILMLNLLISIISDTYGKVSSMKKLSNAYEKTSLIIEIDRKLSKSDKIHLKNKGIIKKYLYVAQCANFQNQEVERFDELNDANTDKKEEISILNKKMDSVEKKLEELEKIKLKIEAIENGSQNSLDKLNRKIDELSINLIQKN